MNNPMTQDTQEKVQSKPRKLDKKLALRKETIKELTDTQLTEVAGGTSSTITIILISLREHVCL